MNGDESAMENFSNDLENKLTLELKDLLTESPPTLQQLEQAVKLCVTYEGRLKDFFKKHPPPAPEEEIRFFKVIKPRLLSQLIYYQKRYQLESQKPFGGPEKLEAYYSRELENIYTSYERSMDLYQYYKAGKTYLDRQYFLRCPQHPDLTSDSYFFDRDPEFSTSHDFKLARMIANERLAEYLTDVLENFGKQPGQSRLEAETSDRALYWTASKADLTELVYALQSVGCLNSGSVEVKTIAAFLEHQFQMPLGNVYRTFLELRGRKKNRTPFLDRLREKLIERMDATDEAGY